MGIGREVRRAAVLGVSLAALLCLLGSAGANVPLQMTEESGDTPGTALAEKSREARQAAGQPEAEPAEEMGPLEDISSTTTLFLLNPAKPEALEAIDVGEGLMITARIRIGDAEVYVIEPEEVLPFDLPILSLEEAQEQGLVEIREINPSEAELFRNQYPAGGGGMVVAQNKADVYILFLGGEVLDGGNQDRMVASSAILPPNSGWVPLPVNCVEKGRSQGDSEQFALADSLAHPVLRVQSVCRSDQRAVWNEVQRVHRIEGTSNFTHTYVQALESGRDRAAVQKASSKIGNLLESYPNAVGLVFVRGGEVQSVERLATPALFRAQKEAILTSHLMGLAVRSPVKAEEAKAATDVEMLQSFFGEVRSADRLRAPLNHQGVGVLVRSPRYLGGETLTNLAPRDPSLRRFQADLAAKGPAPNVLNQWVVRIN
jgi:hypothetical protein